jgi:hypothetical protein
VLLHAAIDNTAEVVALTYTGDTDTHPVRMRDGIAIAFAIAAIPAA